MSERIGTDEPVLVALEDGKTFLIRPQPGRRHSTHKGAVDHDAIIGSPWGSMLETNTGVRVHLLRPRSIDHMMKVKRRTNIMYPKDVAWLLAELDVGPGSRVVEIGCGSGSMTQALARAVRPGGTVFSYDRREEFLELAAANLRAAGIEDGVEFRMREPAEPLEGDVDAIFTDVPEPWVELPVVHAALRGSGRFAAGTPTFNQAERLASALVGGGFALVLTVEVLVREILARPGRTRPSHRMQAHTQLLTSATKVLPLVDAADEATEDDDGEG